MLGRGQRPQAAAARAPLDPEGEADGMSGSSRSTHHNRSDRTARPRGAKRGSKNGGAPGKHARRNSDTSWERAADWYDGWVGAHGSVYHRRVALPATLELLALTSGERLLDIGAGQGVLAPDAARRGAAYVGVELSPRLLRRARERHGDTGRFLLGDARALPPEVQSGAFDAVSFLLSVQDMDPLEAVIGEAARALRPGGRLVLFMVHPCFRVPRQSGWGYDPARKLPVRRIDRYLTPLAVPMGKTTSYHRPLSAYVDALARHRVGVDRLLELGDDEPWARRHGRPFNGDIPLFLALRGVKRDAVATR